MEWKGIDVRQAWGLGQLEPNPFSLYYLTICSNRIESSSFFFPYLLEQECLDSQWPLLNWKRCIWQKQEKRENIKVISSSTLLNTIYICIEVVVCDEQRINVGTRFYCKFIYHFEPLMCNLYLKKIRNTRFLVRKMYTEYKKFHFFSITHY